MVQLAEEVESRLEYAMKFFVSDLAFEQEEKLYMNEGNPLGKFLPKLEMVVKSGSGLNDRWGRTLPSCIVMEKGEALDTWITKASDMDMITALQVHKLCGLLRETESES